MAEIDTEYGHLSLRKEEINQRLEELGVITGSSAKPPPPKKRRIVKLDTEGSELPLIEKTDVHWDYILKEMQWLSADFQAERKRHTSKRKKLANAVKQFHKTKQDRLIRELAEAEMKRRRVAAKTARQVKQWWTKLERIITYKQKITHDMERKKEMNKQLVALVKQTEKYTLSIKNSQALNQSEGSDGITIEQALQQKLETRKSKLRITDYRRMNLSEEESFYGYSTESASDESYEMEDDKDDLSTFFEAQAFETKMNRRGDQDDDRSYVADPIELQKLQEEQEMDIEQVIERLKSEGGVTDQDNSEIYTKERTIKVQFADPGNDADDDGDASDVDDYTDMQDVDDSEDFIADPEERDDETTMIEEEKLPQEMTASEEIALLKSENELSVDELRRKYAQVFDAGALQEDDAETDDAMSTDSDDDSQEFEADPNERDDETTISIEERMPQLMTASRELSLLKSDNLVSVEELRRKYQNILQGEGGEENTSDDEESVQEDDSLTGSEEFEPDLDEQDITTTLDAELQLPQEMSPSEELKLLETDNALSIEELKAKYGNIDEGNTSDEVEISEQESEGNQSGTEGEASDSGNRALALLEASAEKARTTLATRPYLISSWVKLRPYQQTGLNWLVSLQTRRLNGILADEMGLGKTLQTISLLAYLAAYKGIWGPHLIIVPTSVILNWETELKRFCPSLKVLCYYGSAKRRKELRTGWTKSNSYHVVITSYQLAVQDSFAFKRKKWYYMVLDEAQNIKNFQSQRWQTLIHFNTQRRLLLTGTPLQNNLMELWSLLHFLMPYIFRSRGEFSYFFANPMTSMIEGKSDQNNDVISRLHGIIRPFVLRRLKKDVEKEMPGKYEHIVRCHMSRRQMFIYEEFMARSSTRQALTRKGNFMGMMNVLMQLRKVCNHPDLFEPRSILTPLILEPISFTFPRKAMGLCEAQSVSERLVIPCWCGSSGTSSWSSALAHDYLELEFLSSLRDEQPGDSESIAIDSAENEIPEALKNLLHDVSDGRSNERKMRLQTLDAVNQDRCNSFPFLYPLRLQKAVTIEPLAIDKLMSTPEKLLRLREKTRTETAAEFEEAIKKFVFCVPKAEATPPEAPGKYPREEQMHEELKRPLAGVMEPFRLAEARLSSFFPDKKLVQYDSGKLQTLAELLRQLKRGGHKALIFTQMSKMLDILEAFLNLNGHTYLRLDGATGVDRRQRLMDRFNNDPKIFCFILSTRSGGLGINLTGADTCIFYDSDWNPAMDAQAQDRAHRIGQTRDVHIYRLVTQHTIEENILLKAQQKKNLDILVMDKGKFDASQLFSQSSRAEDITDKDRGNADIFTTKGLSGILGVESSVEESDAVDREVSADMLEKTMASLEDADDLEALKGAQKEVAEELKEFDESIEYQKDEENEQDVNEVGDKPASEENTTTEAKPTDDQQMLERDLTQLESEVGLDTAALEKTLSATEKYGLRFREEVDPYYSLYAVLEYQRKMNAEAEKEDAIDIDEIERQKDFEEERAMEEGDLLATYPSPYDLLRQKELYRREKYRLRAEKKLRKMTGEAWETRKDGLTNLPFWYNIDTGEAIWEKPSSLLELEELREAEEEGWSKLPMKALIQILSFVPHFPDRMTAARACHKWYNAASDISFVLHVYPVELASSFKDEKRMHPNHFLSIDAAMKKVLPGESIELGDGHYWLQEDFVVDFPIRLVGDENNPANVVVETTGNIIWNARGGWAEGITFRRQRFAGTDSSKGAVIRFGARSRIDMKNCVFEGGSSAIDNDNKSLGRWDSVVFRNAD